jgi:hypothetical protein
LDFEFDLKSGLVGGLVGTLPTFVLWSVLEYLRDLYWPHFLSSLGYNIPSVINLAIAFTIVFGLFALATIKRYPQNVTAYLFFPKNTPSGDKTLLFHKTHYSHRVIVNFKGNPPSAYHLAPDSYAWQLLEKHPHMMNPEIDTAPHDPQFIQKWCKMRGYNLSPIFADRVDLLITTPYYPTHPLDHRFDHVEYRVFYPFYSHILPKKNPPHRRIIFNRSTKEAFPLDLRDWGWACSGSIHGHAEIASLRRHHPKKWAEEHDFKWSPFYATRADLLRKKDAGAGEVATRNE